MAYSIVIFLIAALVIVLTVHRARARRRALMNGVQQTIRQVSGEPATLKQGNVTVRVRTSAKAEGVGVGMVGEQIGRALSNISPEHLQAQAEAALNGMRENGSTQLSEEQTRAVEAAFRNSFGTGATVIFDPQPQQEGDVADIFAAMAAEPDAFSTKPVRSAPAPAADPKTSNPRDPDARNQDPFSPGDVFERHQEAADARFDSFSEEDRNTSKSRDPFS